jgi:hypothetical protein
MKRDIFDLNIRLLSPEHPARYVRGMTMVGCLLHDQLVPLLERPGWQCPVCSFCPSEDAERAPLVIKRVDFRTGTIVVG